MKFSEEPNLKRAPRLSEQVAGFLAAEIEKGTIRRGDPLPSEAQLSYRFNVSRAVVREALARLQQQGILESKQGSRSRVADNSFQVFRFPFQGLDKATQMAALYELKVLMEGDAAALAAMRCSTDDINNLQACLTTLTMAMQDGLDGGNANFDFHQAILNASGNPLLTSLMEYVNERLWDLLTEDENQPANLALTQQSYQEHVRLFEAIAARDAEQARQALYAHLKNAAKRRGINIFNP